MADKRTQRQQKKREKDKKKRAAAKEARSGKLGSKRVADWPLSEAWISANWPEKGARVHGILTRSHPSGRMAAAVFEVDLAHDGVVSVKKLSDAHPAEVQMELSKRSGEELSMQVTEPERVARLVRDGRLLGEENGVAQPTGIGDAMSMFQDVNPDLCRQAFYTGAPDTSDDEEPSGGLWAGLKKRIGL